MAYRKRWSIPFATMSGASAEIQILEKNYGEGLVETSVTPNQMRGYSFTPSDPTIQEAATLQRVVAYVLASEACSIRIEGSNSSTSFPVRLGTTNVAPAQDVAVSSIDTVNTSSFSKEVSLGAGQYLVIALDTNNVTLTLTKIASIADEDVEVITLQGAEQPFVTEEDNDIDLFMPVRTQSGYIRILTQELPHHPDSFIHLDMVHTFLGAHQVMVYQPMIEKTGVFAGKATTLITCDHGKTSTKEYPNMLEGLKACGMEVEPIFCGGYENWYQDREQWHSGANFFALDDGKIIGYERNVYTIEALDHAGFEVLDADDVCSGKVNMHDYKKFVVAFKASELPRAGGGARCMTMPINRD